MDFATLPPEITSAQMYSGPGSQSMVSAAAAWDTLAAQLYTRAADYHSLTSKLARRCHEPVATTITQGAAPLIDWLRAAAAQAEQAAVHARAAARAYESAMAAIVSPTVINANRTRRGLLVSTNYLGHAGPAIADIDAEYDQLWARNADAMYSYAGASADASTVTPFNAPPSDAVVAAGSWTLTAAPDVISAGRQVMSAIPESLKGLSSSPRARFESTLTPIAPSLSKLNSLTAPSDFAISNLNSMNKAAALQSLFPTPAAVDATSAGFGRGTSVGVLSVPDTVATGAPDPVGAEPLRGGWFGERIRLVAVSEAPGPHAASEYGG
jgi:PPE-repeat protein